MVRCRQEGGFAISIKHQGFINHIKINCSYIDAGQKLIDSNVINDSTLMLKNKLKPYYSIDQRYFTSIIALVSYYSHHLLKDDFPQLDTTLGIAYRDVLPKPISWAIALYDFAPVANNGSSSFNSYSNGSSMNEIELKKSAKYFIVSKEANNWWLVYNSDGLIGYAPSGYLAENGTGSHPSSPPAVVVSEDTDLYD
jgi:hypothetical protein